ncbi:MAG TPA: amidase [Solirubrobacteraceae bacterium]|jgi:aspartyl-tRNA(Asn)/glutamyl-tRNA(Gln) amidotransferase subunit A
MRVSRRTFIAGAAAGAGTLYPSTAQGARRTGAPSGELPSPTGVSAADPADLSLVECASLLQAGKLSSVELMNACLTRSRQRDGSTTAWIRVYPEYATSLAQAADQALAAARRNRRQTPLVTGIPLALKDLYAVKGLPVTASSKVLAGNIALGDSTVWAKLNAAGMVLMGHSETDEFAFGVGTPQCGNPWNPDDSPGGSSGGSGALLGARLIPAATGTDTGGSLRLPATACGTTSIKPSFGRVSAYGVIPLLWSRDHCGAMGRSAADASLLLSYMAGQDYNDPATLSAPPIAQSAYPTMPTSGPKPFTGKRFGVITADVSGIPAATQAVFARFLTEVKSLGATLVDATLPSYPSAGSTGTGEEEYAEAGSYHKQFLPGSLGKYRTEYQALVAACVAAQQALGVGAYLAFEQDRIRFIHQYNALFADNQLTAILLPGSSVDGATRNELAGTTVLSGSVPGDVRWANYAGAPALTTPAGLSAATGMPFGVQIGVRPWQELDLLQLAIDYQAHFPYWAQAPAPLMTPRTLTTADVVAPPSSATADPTGTLGTRPALALVPTRAA